MKQLWEPGDRIVAKLPLPAWAEVFAILVYLLPPGGYLAWMMVSLSKRQVDSAIWVPGLLLSLGLGLAGGFSLARLLFGSVLTLDWSTREAKVTGRNARTFPFARIMGVETSTVLRGVRAVRLVLCSVHVLAGTERLKVRTRSGTPPDRARLEKDTAADARALARALNVKVVAGR